MKAPPPYLPQQEPTPCSFNRVAGEIISQAPGVAVASSDNYRQLRRDERADSEAPRLRKWSVVSDDSGVPGQTAATPLWSN